MTVERDDNEVLYTKENVIISGIGSFRKDWWTVINIYFPSLKNTPAQGDVVMDFTFRVQNIFNKITFLARAGSENTLFMHSELRNGTDGIYLQYYDNSTSPTISESGYRFALNNLYRFVIIFHTDKALYDIKIYDLDNGYTVENICGIYPKSASVTQNTYLTSVEMQNHNTGGTATTNTSWEMGTMTIYDSSKLELPTFPDAPKQEKTFSRIAVDAEGFTKSSGWTNATMPDSSGTAKSLYTANAGEYARYQPSGLKEGWYKVSFWNIKYDNNQNPVKMRATIYADGKTYQDILLPVNTQTENREGIWSEVGTFYFSGDDNEYFMLTTTGGNYARVADVKFELQEDYVPDYVFLSDGLQLSVSNTTKLYSQGGTYALYAENIQEGIVSLYSGNTLLSKRKFKADGNTTYIGTFSFPENLFIELKFNGEPKGKIRFKDVSDTKHVSVKLTDNLMNQQEVYDLSAGDYHVQANVCNPYGTTAVMLCGLFREQEDGTNKLIVSSASDTVSLTDGKGVLSCDLTIYDVENQDTLKIFVWDSLSGMHPIVQPEIYYPYVQTDPYLILADDFQDIGTWTKNAPNDATAFSNTVLNGANQNQETKPANFTLNCKSGGDYKLFVRCKNFKDSAGLRYLKIAVNGTEQETKFGITEKDGYCWEDGGSITLNSGENTISVIDASCYYARLDAILITKNDSFVTSENFTELIKSADRIKNCPMRLTESDFMKNFVIDSNFSGGNIIVDGMKQNTVYIHPDLSDTAANWFYWNFKATSDIDRTVTFVLNGNSYIISASGVAYSSDNDETWNYLSDSAYKTEFTFDMKAGQTVHFSCAIPYVYDDLTSFLNKVKTSYSDRVAVSALCNSEEGREVPMLTIGNTDSEKCVILTSRHHCCESTPSYVLEGLVEYLATNASSSLLDKYCFYVVPMMDVDGVENGDQGKQRIPHDHNRDYVEQIYNSVKALVQFAEDKTVTAFMDFHCPGLQDATPYFYYDSSKDKEVVETFGNYLKEAIAEDTYENKIQYLGERNYDDAHFEACSKGYFYLIKGTPLSTTIEFPYTGKVNDEYTPERMRNFGKNTAKAFEKYLNGLN